jgi:hypothetical protein
MGRKPNQFKEIINILTDLHKDFPSYNLGRHLSTALDGYGDVWGMTDKELLFALQKYKTELELDAPRPSDEEIDEIIKDGLNLSSILDQEDNGEDY